MPKVTISVEVRDSGYKWDCKKASKEAVVDTELSGLRLIDFGAVVRPLVQATITEYEHTPDPEEEKDAES